MEYTTHFVENKDARQHRSTFHLFALQSHFYISFKLQLQQRSKVLHTLVRQASRVSLLSELHSIETLIFSFYVSLEIQFSAYSLHYLAGKLYLPHPAPSLGKTGW